MSRGSRCITKAKNRATAIQKNTNRDKIDKPTPIVWSIKLSLGRSSVSASNANVTMELRTKLTSSRSSW